MKTYKDIFPINEGLFKEIFFVEYPELYSDIFEDLNPLILDTHAMYHYGDKKVISKLNLDTVNIVKSFIEIYKKVWLTQKSLLSLEYDILKPFNVTDEKTGFTDISNDSNNISLNGVTAFNDEQIKDRERTTEEGTNSKKEEYNFKNTRSGTNSGFNFTTTIQKEVEFRKQNFYRQVIGDIVRELVLKIY